MQHVNIFRSACLLGTFLLFTCGQPDTDPADPPAPAIAEAIIGTWETVEVEVTSETYGGQDTTVHQLITEADWGRKYGTKPARTRYMPDGKSERTYYNIHGQAIDVTHGLWRPQGTDSLFVIEPSTTIEYRYELDGSRLTLTGMVDWDNDGEQDDAYRGVLRLVARTD